MRKYKQRELRDLVRLGVAEDYTNKPIEYIYTLRRLEVVRDDDITVFVTEL